ncbi:MAG: T9SS type A sorting domain-containing protein [Saprospiraceae bacterium]
MQRQQLLFLFITFHFFGHAVAQIPEFAPLGARWTYSQTDYAPAPYFAEYPRVIEVVAKEMYQGKLCSKLIGVDSTTAPIPLYLYQQHDSVWYYSDRSAQFELLYDFGAEAGESWVIKGLYAFDDFDSLGVAVDSISYLIVQNDTFRVMHIRPIPAPDPPHIAYGWGTEIVSHIGNTLFLTPFYSIFHLGVHEIRCYEDDSLSVQFVPFPCDTIRDIREIISISEVPDKRAISVAPNPFNNEVAFDMTVLDASTDYLLMVTDLYGRVVYTAQTQGGKGYVWNAANIANGPYVYQIRSDDAILYSGKLLKVSR